MSVAPEPTSASVTAALSLARADQLQRRAAIPFILKLLYAFPPVLRKSPNFKDREEGCPKSRPKDSSGHSFCYRCAAIAVELVVIQTCS
eukprot:4230971-Amphidinium_carterae.1